MKKIIFVLCISLFLFGCGTWTRYRVVTTPTSKSTEIISTPLGAKIEINNEYIGETPLNVEIIRKQTFIVSPASLDIVAYPSAPGQYTQKKYIAYHEQTPRKIYFNMDLIPVSPRSDHKVDVNIKENQ